MGRRRKAWLVSGTGRRKNSRTGENYPGFYAAFNDYEGGKRVQRTQHFHAQRDARQWVKRQNAKADLELLDQVVSISIRDASNEFIAGLSARTRETARQYSMSILQFAGCVGNIDVSAVGREEVDRFVRFRMANGTEATAAKHCRALKAFFAWCKKGGYHTYNPIGAATSLPRNNLVRTKMRISDEQFVRLIDSLDTEDRRLGVQIAATTGLDRNVIIQMRPPDVDLEHRVFRLVRFKINRPVYPYIHDSLVPPIRRRVGCGLATRPLLRGLHRQGGEFDWWKVATKKAGISGFRFVDLRTYAVNWLRAILGDFDAQKIVGHSSPAVTARHYYQENPQSQALISSRPLPGSAARDGTATNGAA